MAIEDGGQAFPVGAANFSPMGDTAFPENGMSLRDWFAGQAMAAIIAKTAFVEAPEDWVIYEKTAIGAYDYADAMVKARQP